MNCNNYNAPSFINLSIQQLSSAWKLKKEGVSLFLILKLALLGDEL